MRLSALTALFLLGLALFPAWAEGAALSLLLPVLALAVGIGACLLGRGTHDSPLERRFFGALALSLSAWLAALGLQYSIDADWVSHPRLALVGDGLYALIYLAFLLALEVRPHASDGTRPQGGLRSFALGGSTVFVAALFAYFVAAPHALDRAAYASWIPSGQLWLLLDLCLIARLTSLTLTVEDRGWRRTYAWLLAAVLLWGAIDTLCLLGFMGALVHDLPEPSKDALWFLTPLLIAIAARLRRARSAAPSSVPSGDFIHSLWGGSLLANAILIALVHLGALRLAPSSPGVRGARDLLALGAILLLLVLAAFSERRLRAENRRLEDEQAAANERMRLALRLEALGKLAGGVAHDFNNMLQVVRVCGEQLVDGLADRPALQLQAQEIVLAGERATTLTAQLLSLARTPEQRPVALDLCQSVTRVAGLLRRIIGTDVRIETRLEPDVGPIFADRGQLEHVLLNLGVNARDALPGGGTIRFTVARAPARAAGGHQRAHALLCVQDTGRGMDAATQARIFEPFFTTKRDGRGTGLGLTLARSFVEDLGGTIEVESAPGAGTTFRLSLPLSSLPAAAPAALEPSARLRGTSTVLVAEDERAVRSVLCGFLQEGGFRVREAADGVQALASIEREGAPELVLTDVCMPEMDGPELARRLAARYPELPVIFMTGYATAERIPREHRAAALQKPFTRAQLEYAVRLALTLVPRPTAGAETLASAAGPKATET